MTIYVYQPKDSDQELIRSILASGGYQNLYFGSTPDQTSQDLALDSSSLIYAARLDLCIIDISEGAMGLNLVKKILQSDNYAEVPVIVLADDTDQKSLEMAFAFGAVDFIAKPIRSYDFLARVRSCLKLKHEVDRRKAREKELVETTSQLEDLTKALNLLSLQDGLTGLNNRRSFDLELDSSWKNARRQESPLSLILIDIDFFKKYNDTYGHQEGDECLRQVASYLQGVLKRPADVVARYGGEEFAIILPDTPQKGAELMAERIQQAVAMAGIPHRDGGETKKVTVSQGICTIEAWDQQLQKDFIQSADRALYLSKEKGRNTYSFHPYVPSDSSEKKSS